MSVKQRYEYTSTIMSGPGLDDTTIRSFAEKGWRVVGFTQNSNGFYTVLFERELKTILGQILIFE